MNGWELAALLLAWGLGGGSPGPATLTISGTAMARGRIAGVVPGFGIVCGSAFWGGASAFGMAAVMLTNAWLSIALKYIGALYLGYLALKSFRSAWQGNAVKEHAALNGSLKRVFAKSLTIHLTNPKAIFGWGAIYAIALPQEASTSALLLMFAQLICVSSVVFIGYGSLFSKPWIVERFRRARRGFEIGFGVLFGAASLKILTTKAI